jgi:hypothetical protein
VTALFLVGCASGSNVIVGPPPPPAPTSVTLILSSSANDPLSQLFITPMTITLTNAAGASITLYMNPEAANVTQSAEFIHLNGDLEPFVMLSVPQGEYTSASLAYSNPGFSYVTLDPDGSVNFHTDTDASLGIAGYATIRLSSPLTISGAAMTLSLDLQVSQSVAYTTIPPPVGDTFSITPVFNLTPFPISPGAANDPSKQNGINGRVTSIAASNNPFSLQTPDQAALLLSVNSSTVFHGVPAFSALASGMFVDMDTAIQPGGSLLATRIEVEDPTAINTLQGPLIQLPNPPRSSGIILVIGRQEQGDDLSVEQSSTLIYQFVSSTTFQISTQFANLQSLPFPASFNSSNIFLGQNVYVSSPALSFNNPPACATTITLMPQTINGSVRAVFAANGNLPSCAVTLAPNDLISVLNGTTTVIVYADTATRMLNFASIAVGSLFRFNGLLCNDNGVLRMDCAQINDGVAE